MKAIFVVGPMRSGTSLTAKLLASHPSYSLGPGAVNHNGENSEFMAKNRMLIRSTAGGEGSGIPTSANRIGGGAVTELENWLRFAEAECENVVLKDPRCSLTLGIWLTLVKDAAVVVTLRDPACVAESLLRTQRMTEVDCREHIALYYECIFRALSEYRVPVAFVRYENLLVSPMDELGPVCRTLGLDRGKLELNLPDKELWHFRPEGA